jgi:hypothetical protein
MRAPETLNTLRYSAYVNMKFHGQGKLVRSPLSGRDDWHLVMDIAIEPEVN